MERKRCYKKRMWWRRDDFWWGLRPCGSSHKTCLTEHAVWFFTTLSGWFHQVFFLWVVGKSFRIKTGTLTTLSAYCILHTLNSGNLSFNDKRQCTESVALRQVLAPPWAAPCAQWRTRLLRLRSRLVRCFHLASFRVRFSICALRSFPHFIISC